MKKLKFTKQKSADNSVEWFVAKISKLNWDFTVESWNSEDAWLAFLYMGSGEDVQLNKKLVKTRGAAEKLCESHLGKIIEVLKDYE